MNEKLERDYAKIEIDRETIQAASADKAAFLAIAKERMDRAIEQMIQSSQRDLFGGGTGELRLQISGDYDAWRKEHNKPINRLKRKLVDYKDRINDSWLVLTGKAEIRIDDEDY